ncbi:hypothetical protein QQF64_034342 [Cirrhinus molitorella]|uniref:Uncharacterized protein n=1 Tax=Cirrhinus molitorella TaxID=172907 RepID=A0ABR3L1C6_9TELE
MPAGGGLRRPRQRTIRSPFWVSDDPTTCHLVVLRNTAVGATCIAHCDGSSTWTEVPLIVNAVTSRSNQQKRAYCRFGSHR